MLSEYICEKIMDGFITLIKNQFESLDRFNCIDLAVEGAIADYARNQGEDAFYNEARNILSHDLKRLQDILDGTDPSREVIDELADFFANLIEGDTESAIVVFLPILFSNLIRTDEYGSFFRQLRHDYETGKIFETVTKGLVNSSENQPHLLTGSPPKIDPDKFKHREKEVDEIASLLESQNKSNKKIVLLNGLGGIGKTTIARCIYHQLKDRYKYAAWIEYGENLRESLLSQICLFDEEKDREIRYQKIKTFLTNEKVLLLVVDNVNQDVGLDNELALLTAIDSTVLVTSRMPGMEHFMGYKIDFMSSEQCVDIFYSYYPHDKKRKQGSTVKKLVELVKCHTFSVELLAKAADVIKYRDLSIFLDDLKGKGFTYPNRAFLTDHTGQKTTLATHLVILFNMVSLNDEQKRILNNFAWLPSMIIPC